MQQLIYFFQKYKYFLFFLLLSFIAFFFTINNNNFHKSKFISSANEITGGFYQKSAQFSDYFKLKTQNEELITENTRLKNLLEKLKSKGEHSETITVKDSTKYHQKYTYTPIIPLLLITAISFSIPLFFPLFIKIKLFKEW